MYILIGSRETSDFIKEYAILDTSDNAIEYFESDNLYEILNKNKDISIFGINNQDVLEIRASNSLIDELDFYILKLNSESNTIKVIITSSSYKPIRVVYASHSFNINKSDLNDLVKYINSIGKKLYYCDIDLLTKPISKYLFVLYKNRSKIKITYGVGIKKVQYSIEYLLEDDSDNVYAYILTDSYPNDNFMNFVNNKLKNTILKPIFSDNIIYFILDFNNFDKIIKREYHL